MSGRLPSNLFGSREPALILSDATGRIQFCSEAAASWLGCEAATTIGKRCWKVARFRQLDGSPFCSQLCPVQRRSLAASEDFVRHTKVSQGNRRCRLVSYSLLPEVCDRRTVLHIIEPQPIGETDQATRNLAALSPRELEVLTLLSRGLATGAVAERLFISRTTVRNHVQSILSKLGVHRRIEAVVALLVSSRHSPRE
jgi:DNA-binding CsgD family transcriptional regulator